MCTLLSRVWVLGVLAVAAAGCDTANEASTESAAPPVATSDRSSRGGPASPQPSLAAAKDKAPAVLYFVKADCGSNPQAIPLVKKIYEANKDSGKFYVVMNTDQAGADAWAKEWKTEFPIIPDPDKEIIGEYGVRSSQTGVLVDKDLKETKRFGGYGKKALESLNASLGDAKVDLSDAPPSGAG